MGLVTFDKPSLIKNSIDTHRECLSFVGYSIGEFDAATIAKEFTAKPQPLKTNAFVRCLPAFKDLFVNALPVEFLRSPEFVTSGFSLFLPDA